jgi:hypothetical protein
VVDIQVSPYHAAVLGGSVVLIWVAGILIPKTRWWFYSRSLTAADYGKLVVVCLSTLLWFFLLPYLFD